MSKHRAAQPSIQPQIGHIFQLGHTLWMGPWQRFYCLRADRVLRRLACWVLLSLLGLATMSLPAAAQDSGQVEARVDRIQVADTESFTLILEIKDGALVASPDLSVLGEDFHILSTSTQTSMQLVNGHSSRSTQIHVGLQAKHVGNLTIPAIRIGQAQTEPITITVSNTPNLVDQGGQEEVILEVDAEPKTGSQVYVQSQLSLVVRLFYPDGLTQGNLGHPEIENVVVELLDELKYTSRRGSKSYNVLERRYAIQAERSGELVIPPIRFDGRISRAARSFFSTPMGRRIRAASDPLSFTVRAQPNSFTGSQWLPARKLVLSMSQDKTQARVGEPITRVISLRGEGLSHTQLPDLPQIEVAGGRVYPDPGEGSTGRSDRWMVAQREFQQAIIPSRTGRLHIPESRIEWWDVVNDRQQSLVIPGLDLDVLPPLGESAPASSDALGAGVLPPTVSANGVPQGALGTTQGTTQLGQSIHVDTGWWPWVSAGFALLWLMTLLLWWRQARQPREWQQQMETPVPDLKSASAELTRACQANHPQQARQALLRWAAARWPEDIPLSPLAVAEKSDNAELRDAINELQAVSYGRAEADWRGEALSRAISQLPLREKAARSKQDPLPPLYPKPN